MMSDAPKNIYGEKWMNNWEQLEKRKVLRDNAIRVCKAFVDTVNDINNLDNKKLENTTVIKVLNCYFEHPIYKIVNKGKVLFRARRVKYPDDWNTEKCGISMINTNDPADLQFTGYDEFNSKEPPLNKLHINGRNNIKGMSYLYLADNEYTACSETNPRPSDCLSVASFRANKRLKLFDLTVLSDKSYLGMVDELEHTYNMDLTLLLQYLTLLFYAPVDSDGEYYSSQLISDYVRKAGYDGIRYKSAKANGYNITLFNSHKTYISFLESKLVLVESCKYSYIDFNTSKRLQNQTFEPLTYEQIAILKSSMKPYFEKSGDDNAK